MLVKLGLVEQRYKAVCEVLDGATVTDVARRNGVARHTVHDWLRRYGGLAGLVDGSSKPSPAPIRWHRRSSPHPRAAPGPSRLGPTHHRHRLGREGMEPVPGRSSMVRVIPDSECLVPLRHRDCRR